MASADLRQELVCSICLSIYTDPVTLRCGHNFCRVCIDRVLDTQEGSGVYSCPDCRAESQERPALIQSIALRNIVESFQSTRSDQEETGIFCTYCVDSPVPAAKSCLLCEASLCDKHLRVHSKSAEHVLCDPTTALGNRKCSVHKKILEYYCTEDAVCVCVSCTLTGEHRGHQVEMLDKASEKKKEKLRNVLQKLTTKKAETEKRVQRLQERRREYQGKAAGVTERVSALFRDIRRQLEDLEKRVLNEISRQQRVSLSVSVLIQQLEIKKDELSGKMRHIEELCNMSDPVTVLQEPDTGDLCDTEDMERHDNEVCGAGDLDVGLISETLHTLSVIITDINHTSLPSRNIREDPKNQVPLLAHWKGGQVSRGAHHSPATCHTVPVISALYIGGHGHSDASVATRSECSLSYIAVPPSRPHVTSCTPSAPPAAPNWLPSPGGGSQKVGNPGINTGIYVQEATDLLLDVATAGNKIQISGDSKTASRSDIYLNRPETPHRFQGFPQVISTRGFSSGRHYWEVDVSKSVRWWVGMCYPSIGRKGNQSVIGYNNKSWCVCRWYDHYSVTHDSTEIWLDNNIHKVRVYLDYEAGQLSFYALCDPIIHLHTFTAALTEPLHAALCVEDECVTICGGVRSWEELDFLLSFLPPAAAMASADLRQELDCSICLSIYTDPVTLRCGHNFCRVCIDRVLDTQEGSGVYSCPDCRAECQERPALIRNIPLCNILGRFLSTRPDQEETGIFCTYCIHSPVPAAKSCQLCEASLCDKHLRVHSKSPEHVLCDPTTALGNRKCSVHKKILEYYCTEDSVCICVYCSAGEHRGHQVEMLDEASEKKKEKLRNVLQKLTTKRAETEKRVQSLQERRREDQRKATGITETVTALFRDIRRQLEDLEKRVLSEISRQEQRVSLSVSDLIQQLKIKKDELSGKMRHIEELCNMSDPVTVLQEPDTGDLCDTEDTERHDNQVRGAGDLDVGLISGTLHTLSDIITYINTGIYVQEATALLLDVATAGNYIQISGDRKTASRSHIYLNRPETPQRFQGFPQVISTRRFSSGRHYWEVDVSKSVRWWVGMCYPSIGRKGEQSLIGGNNKSWCLRRYNNQYSVRYDSTESRLADNIPCDRVRVYLDYEAGQLSFYALCDPIIHLHRIRHLHTFTAALTEPLHAELLVGDGCVTICGGVRSWEKLP
ncbi:E3 ubiquitin/ISG15 ligase TRIM25-like [Pseudophryne corroboree]|uniref:E3 ubiquitin/ISG15 ligase TRIM25-like n=1 Tax=Pseudophryne corroboree TaxID=495146 RepID=UPI003081C6F5